MDDAKSLEIDDATRQVIDLFSKKWVLLVLFALLPGPGRLSKLQRDIGSVSQKMLVESLRDLEAKGFVRRTVYPVVPPHVEYALTPLGESLRDPLMILCKWGEDNLPRQLR